MLPDTILFEFCGKVQEYTAGNGYPYECKAKDKHPNSTIYYCIADGAWIASHEIELMENGHYKFIHW